MGDSDVSQIINAITNLHGGITKELNDGFRRVYEEIGRVCQRIEPLEKDKLKRDLLTDQEEKQEKKKIDWRGWLIKGLIAAFLIQYVPNLVMMIHELVKGIMGIK